MNRTYQVGETRAQPWFNKTGSSMKSPVKIENLPIVMSQQRNQSKKKDSSIIANSYGSRTTTPDGCKGVQIDSSMDMRDEDCSEHIKHELTLKSKGDGDETTTNSEGATPQQDEQQQLELVPKIHMSTHLFNGDYLVNTVNQNTPSM